MKRLLLLLSLPMFFLVKFVVPAVAGEADCTYHGITILDGDCPTVDGKEICCDDGWARPR
jgi:hypothetical protein